MEWNGMEWNGMEWNGMERNRRFWFKVTYEDHLVQLLDLFSADDKLKHIIEDIVQMPLKH